VGLLAINWPDHRRCNPAVRFAPTGFPEVREIESKRLDRVPDNLSRESVSHARRGACHVERQIVSARAIR